jgi:hypothetical protein
MGKRNDDMQRSDDMQHIDELLPAIYKEKHRPLSRVQQRMMDAATASSDLKAIIYQHSALCQTYLPVTDPGDDVLTWERRNGGAHLEVRAGKAMHPEERRLVQQGVPFGPKARLLLLHINQLAIRNQSAHIEIEDSLTGFVRRTLRLDVDGRTIGTVKKQLSRLAAADITLGVVHDSPGMGTVASTKYFRVVTGLDLWLTRDENQRVLWPSVIDLSEEYFRSLTIHAVPLDENHIAALAHSAMMLDIYAWLAQRLHRIDPGKPAFVPWGGPSGLHAQFGQGYTGKQAVKNFRRDFTKALRKVKALYKTARVTEGQQPPAQRVILASGKAAWREPLATGLTLRNSPPPVPRYPR